MKESKELADLFDLYLDHPMFDIDTPRDVNSKAMDGDSLLHMAVRKNDLRAIRLLLTNGCDVNQIGDMGRTALHEAIDLGLTKVVELLVEAGASAKIVDEFGDNAVTLLKKQGNNYLLEFLGRS